MRLVYRTSVVGIIGTDWQRYPIANEQNIIAKNKKDALTQFEEKKSKFERVWNAYIKFNFKETLKIFILDLFNLNSIELIVNKKDKKDKNDSYFSLIYNL